MTITKPTPAGKVPENANEARIARLKGKTRKGCPNKVTREAKEIALSVANELSLSDWVKKSPLNERLYWTVIFPKIIEQMVSHKGGVDLNVSWF